MGMVVRILLSFILAASASAFADDVTTKVVGKDSRGPRDYHPTYASIFNTVVVIQGFYVRTNDGQVLRVRGPRMNVDLQDLKDFRRGIVVDMRSVIPAGQFVDVVEIQANVVDCSNHYINFRDAGSQFGSQCKLKTPKTINFYTTNGPVAMGAFEYLVKSDFSPLNSIQLDLVTIKKEIKSCWSPFGDSSYHEGVCKKKYEYKSGKLCELANQRQPILNIVRKIDEA